MFLFRQFIFFILLSIYFNLDAKIFSKNRILGSQNLNSSKQTILKKDENIFSSAYSNHVIIKNNSGYIWVQKTKDPFTELILSWNGFRPKTGSYSFLVSARYNNHWSSWYKIDQWFEDRQQTFLNTKNPYVKIKHVRLEMQKKQEANAFRVKIISNNGANLKNIKRLFASVSNMNKFSFYKKGFNLPSIMIKDIPRVSQWNVKHSRTKDLCSPTSTSMVMAYFSKKGLFKNKFKDLNQYVAKFAEKVRDGSYLDIYGAWPLNVAQVFDESLGKLIARVKRLNGINELYGYLIRKIPIAVSVRGYLRGGFKPYNNGHFIIVVGWDKQKDSVLCIDPAFVTKNKMLRAYNFKDFMHAWGVSRNLAYIILPFR